MTKKDFKQALKAVHPKAWKYFKEDYESNILNGFKTIQEHIYKFDNPQSVLSSAFNFGSTGRWCYWFAIYDFLERNAKSNV
jgi:hypothetical protein